MFDSTCHFDLKTGSCQHTVCYYVAWQCVETENNTKAEGETNKVSIRLSQQPLPSQAFQA